MKVHTPKAVHGWRELLNEVGVIAIGVLIALGAEQALEALHWRHQVEAGEEMLRDDARFLVYAAARREAQSACIGRRLATIADLLDAAGAAGRLPAIGQLGAPSMAYFPFASWTVLSPRRSPRVCRASASVTMPGSPRWRPG